LHGIFPHLTTACTRKISTTGAGIILFQQEPEDWPSRKVEPAQLPLPYFSELLFTVLTISGSALATPLNKLNPLHHLPHLKNTLINYHSQSNGALLTSGQKIMENSLQMQ
jgi:hypothetical protein